MVPQVSVCIPVLNGESFLTQAIDSVLSQQGVSFELRIVNNGSTDASFDIARKYQFDSRVHLVSHPFPLGMGADWTRATINARAELIKVLPCDDILLPGSLQSEVTALLAHPKASFAASPRVLITRRSRKIKAMFPIRPGMLTHETLERLLLPSARNPIGEPGAVTFRKTFFRSTCGFDNSLLYFCDADLWLRLSRLGPGIMLKHSGVGFRAHGSSLTSKNRSSIHHDCLRFCAKHGCDQITKTNLLRIRLTTVIRQVIVSILDQV